MLRKKRKEFQPNQIVCIEKEKNEFMLLFNNWPLNYISISRTGGVGGWGL